MKLDQYNIASSEFKVNPYPLFEILRKEEPIAEISTPGGGKAYLITRYEDVEAALKDNRFTTDIHTVMPPEVIAQVFSDSEFMNNFLSGMLFKTPPIIRDCAVWSM